LDFQLPGGGFLLADEDFPLPGGGFLLAAGVFQEICCGYELETTAVVLRNVVVRRVLIEKRLVLGLGAAMEAPQLR
jgi:hypothetical protein